MPAPRPARRDFRFFDTSLDEFLASPLSNLKMELLPTPSKPSQFLTKYELRGYLREHSQHTTVRGCNSFRTCKSEFLCPFCTPKRLHADRASIDGILRGAPSAEFATLTAQHSTADSLMALWDAITGAWAVMSKGKGWDTFRTRHAVSGQIRAFDCTWSAEQGWHPHWHCAFVFEKELTEHALAGFRAELAERWVAALHSLGYSAQAAAQRSEAVRNPAAVAAYLTGTGPFKLSVTDSPSFTPGDLLHAATDGDLAARELWGEYETASLHRRALAGAGAFRTMPRIAQRRVVQFE